MEYRKSYVGTPYGVNIWHGAELDIEKMAGEYVETQRSVPISSKLKPQD